MIDNVRKRTDFGPGAGVARFVAQRASVLQDQYLRGHSNAKATLATLRSGADKHVATNPLIWQTLFLDFPTELMGRGDDPSPEELATATALSLFGIHMQSAQQKMHAPGIGLGAAIRKVAGPPNPEGNEDPLITRFHALGTAASFEEARHHSRGLIQQLRSATPPQPLDYGRLARDFYDLQSPLRADSVRLRWARDLYRWQSSDPSDDQETSLENES